MIRLLFYFCLVLFLSNCSTDIKSKFFKNKNEEIKSVKKPSDIKFSYDLSFDQFKKNAIEYGKLSDYPKLDD
tara:strand:+ start:1100 stop:1315 length:216 start_codon:yes stop_codon:yes gene_type:complete